MEADGGGGVHNVRGILAYLRSLGLKLLGLRFGASGRR